MRKIYVYRDGRMVEKGSTNKDPSVPIFMKDIEPYRSMVTGEEITSRSKHRQHLRDHGMMEIGNDSSLLKPYSGMPDTNPVQRKEILRHEVNKFTHDEWRKMGKKEIERLRYNTRGIPER